MKKALVCLTSFTLLSVSSTGVVKRRVDVKPALVQDSNYNTVCVNGKLFYGSETGTNMLPTGFYGNRKDEGVFEVGFQAGDPLDGNTPPLYVSDVGTCSICLSVQFEKKLDSLPLCERRTQFGYDIEILKADQSVDSFSYRHKGSRIRDIFTGDHDRKPALDDSDAASQGYSFAYYASDNALCLSFRLFASEKLIGFRLYYGDEPLAIKNAAFCFQGNDLSSGFNAKYSGNDCSARSYTKRIDTNRVYTMDVQMGKMLSKSYLLSKFIARDVQDATEFHVEEIEDPNGYFLNGDKAPLGSVYEIALVARDQSGNVSRLRIQLHVVDTEGPYIEAKESDVISCSYQEVCAEESFVSQYYHIVDASGSPLRYELKELDGSRYHQKEVGEKQANLYAYDAEGNYSVCTMDLDLFDDVPPEITVDANEVNVSPDKVLSSSEILSLFHVTDEIDGKLVPEITENTYSANAKKVGSYRFTIKATDLSGNEATKTIRLNVVDTEGPVFYAKESVMSVIQGQIPSVEEMIQSLVRQGIVPDQEYVDYEILEGEEINNDLSVGTHVFKLNLIDVDGGEVVVDLTLEVKEASNLPLPSDTDLEEELNFWQKIGRWFMNLFRKIGDFFRNLF